MWYGINLIVEVLGVALGLLVTIAALASGSQTYSAFVRRSWWLQVIIVFLVFWVLCTICPDLSVREAWQKLLSVYVLLTLVYFLLCLRVDSGRSRFTVCLSSSVKKSVEEKENKVKSDIETFCCTCSRSLLRQDKPVGKEEEM